MEARDRYPLGSFPTPVHRLPSLSDALRVDLWVKRDDLSGLAAGGNKVRKLEYLVAAAKQAGASVLITAGAIQSNHVLQTVAAARKAGMRAIAVLHGKRPAHPTGNLILDEVLGADLEFVESDRFVEDVIPYMERRRQELANEGIDAYLIPVGGSNALGALGYVACAAELARQFEQQGLQPPDVVVAPTGSVGTYAGLVVGVSRHWPSTRVRGIVVTTNYFAQRELVASLTNETAALAGEGRRWTPADLELTYDYVGPGYGRPSAEGDAAILTMARAEGIFLDPTYTGKTFAGLLGSVKNGAIGEGSRVLFIHTGGSTALLARA